jgi:hypothetical protein
MESGMDDVGFYLKHPFTCLVCGPTQSGKSHFVMEMVRNATERIRPAPQRIVWHYGQETKDMDTLERLGVELQRGLHDRIQPEEEENVRTLIIIDDLMVEAGNAQDVSDMFTKGSHHENMSVVLILQNLFHQSSKMRRISLNTQYVVLMKNPRDISQVRCFAQQLDPGNVQFVVNAYKQATMRPHGYLLVDLTQTTPDDERILSDVFADHGGYCYIPK